MGKPARLEIQRNCDSGELLAGGGEARALMKLAQSNFKPCFFQKDVSIISVFTDFIQRKIISASG